MRPTGSDRRSTPSSTHPVHAITLSIAGVSLARCLIPEVIVNLGMIPTTEYAMPASAEGATVIREPIQRYDAVIWQRHGSVTIGKDVLGGLSQP